MEKILEIKKLNVSFQTYAGEVRAVRDLDMELFRGETLAIVGESGCGKTATSKAIMKLLPEPPAKIKEGSSIEYREKDILKLNEKELRKIRGGEISMIFQDPEASLNPTMSIGDQIAEGIRIHRSLSKKETYDEVIKVMKEVKFSNPKERMREYPHQFSRGMKQRAMIAMAFSCNPKILIADEPTTALDVTIEAQIMDLMENLQKKFGTSIMLITHNLGLVARMADRIHVMYAGKIVEKGSRDEIFYNPQHPYTWALLKSVPLLSAEKKSELFSIEGTPPDLINLPYGCSFSDRCKYSMAVCRETEPQENKITDTHSAACWLMHPMAPKIKNPVLVGEN